MNQREAANQQLVQFGILIGTLGLILCLMGLYPGITGVEPKIGIGVLQVIMILLGMTLIILGAFIFVKVGFYPEIANNLAQRIALRLSLTGLLFAAGSGLADVLGFGSNPTIEQVSFPILGPYQAWGMVMGFMIAALGVILFGTGGPATRP
jgi:hypothetical protein